MTYSHPNAANPNATTAIPNLKPKTSQSPFTMSFTYLQHRPMTIT